MPLFFTSLVTIGTFHVDGMKDLMLVELILTLVPLCFAFFFLRDGPPSPPSHSTKMKQSGGAPRSLPQLGADDPFHDGADEALASLQETGKKPSFTHSQSAMTVRFSKYPDTSAKHDDSANPHHHRSHVWEEVQQLFGDRNFVLLAISFCVGVGFFNSVMTLLNQIVSPYGYSNDDAGTFGAVFIVCGLVGAGIMGKVLEVTKAYLSALRVGIILAGLANVLCFSLLYRDNFWVLVAAFGLLGGCVLPLLPAMLENCAECTYPIPEEVSAGILYSGSNLSALGFIFALQVSV
jgi:Na+/melibiose symporter-like transporter